MKTRHLPLVFLLSGLLFSACQKDNSLKQDTSATPTTISFAGNWQEVKVNIYAINNGTPVYNVTYLHPLDQNDFLHIYSNGSASVGQDCFFSQNPPLPEPPDSVKYTYAKLNSQYVIVAVPTGVTGLPGVFNDTVSFVHGDTLRWHDAYTTYSNYNTYTDSYYVKQ